MTCTCDFDEHNWPSMEPGCPVHDRPKTFSEHLHGLPGWFVRQLSKVGLLR